MPRIVRMHGFGGPEVLHLDEVEAESPGAGEVSIRVAAIGLNRVECMYRSGGFGAARLPAKIGYEAAGVIDRVGEGVLDFRPGDRVATIPGLPMERYGTYGELILYRADMLARLPPHLPMQEAAATWMQYLTAYALIAIAKIRRGDRVIVTAASSSVGLAAMQIINLTGAIPIAVTRTAAKSDSLVRSGAAHVLISDEQDVTRAVLDLTEGRGAEVAFDGVCGTPFSALIEATAHGGLILVYGALGGAMTIPPASIMQRNTTIRGFAMNEMLADPAHRNTAIAFINQGLKDRTLWPIIDRSFTLDQIVEAHRYLESNVQLGKIVIDVA